MSKQQALAGVIGQRETAVIGAVVDEIVASPQEQYGLKLMPIKAYPEYLVYTEKVSGFGGLLAERVIGEEGKAGSASSSETFEFSPGAYQEAKRFTEKDLIALRRLGSMGERGATGLTAGALDFMSRAGMDLQQKLTNRLNQLAWDVLFTGKYMYQGSTKFDFAVPTANTVQAATDWSLTASSTPFTDLMNIIKLNPVYFKYIIKEFVINPKTEMAMLTSQEARTLIINNAYATGDINKIAAILFPGLPPIKVVKDAYSDQSIVGGKIVNGLAKYFVPDYKVLAVVDFGGHMFTEYGEIQMTYNINDPSATVEKPAMGIYTFVDEEGLSKRKAPWVDVVTGFNGGTNLMRSNDVLIIKAKPGI
jgi:hypothetical protein